MYETIMGSVAYGVSGDTSDMDVCGWAIPPKDDVFPHLRGEVAGFGTPRPRFEQFEAHDGSLAGCVEDPDRAVAALRGIQHELDRVRDLL